jgi:hypothetical protein
MRRLLVLIGLAAAAPLAAQQVTQKFDYKPVKQIQPIEFGLDKIQIRQVVFAPPSPAGGKQHHSASEAVVRIDNDGEVAAAVGVAIAIFDGEGNIVAAGCGGTHAGYLAPGEREMSAIRFPFVYRNLEKAKSFVLTMEVQKKGS